MHLNDTWSPPGARPLDHRSLPILSVGQCSIVSNQKDNGRVRFARQKRTSELIPNQPKSEGRPIDSWGQPSEHSRLAYALRTHIFLMGEAMEAVNRRSTLALGLTVAATPLITWGIPAAAQTYGPTEGKEVAPGVRVVALGERASVIPAYATVKLRDVVIQPGAKTPDNVMMNDMLCHLTEGELSVVQNEKTFVVKKGDVWTCTKDDTTEGTQNTGSEVAIMRVIDLLTA